MVHARTERIGSWTFTLLSQSPYGGTADSFIGEQTVERLNVNYFSTFAEDLAQQSQLRVDILTSGPGSPNHRR